MLFPDERRIRLLEAAAAILDAAPNRRLNTVSLNKALFYLDLLSLRDKGSTFTQNAYIALEMGPVVAKYPTKLIKAMEREGIATQGEMGLANPVTLIRLPSLTRVTGEISEMASSIAKWCARQTSKMISDYSHNNIGWIIAREDERHSGKKQVIDMNIAMQQIVNDDPWVNSALSQSSQAACNLMDTKKGLVW